MTPNYKPSRQSYNNSSISATLPRRVNDCDSSRCTNSTRDSATPVLLIPGSPLRSPSPAPSDTPLERIPRPPNSFMLFRSDFLKRDVIPASVEKRQQTLSRVAGEVWNLMPPEEKKKWHDKSAEALRLHHLRHPDYKFSPVRRGSARKTKVKAAEEGTTSKDRIRELRETYLHMQGPAVPSTRRKKGEQRGSASKAKDERVESASESTGTSTRSRSRERTLSEEPPLPMIFPRPSYPHLLADLEQRPSTEFGRSYDEMISATPSPSIQPPSVTYHIRNDKGELEERSFFQFNDAGAGSARQIQPGPGPTQLTARSPMPRFDYY